MSNKQNDIIYDNIREAKEEPLGELVGIVENMLGRGVKIYELNFIADFLSKYQHNIMQHCQKAALEVFEKPLDKIIEKE